MGAEPVHDGLLKTAGPCKVRVCVKLEYVPRQPVQERLVRGRNRVFFIVGGAVRERHRFGGTGIASESPVLSAEQGENIGKEFSAV